MAHAAKDVLVRMLTPVAVVVDRTSALQRLWAHTRLRAALGGCIDPSVVVASMPELHGTRRIELGRNLFLYRDLYLETRESGRIQIGDGCVLSRGVHLVSFAEILIEDGVMIGEYTSVRDANHRIVPGESVRYTGHVGSPIRIQRNAWIGRGATILPGVTVGAGAIVGANAVVTKDVKPGAVVVGVPARNMVRSSSG
jgi:acetyltransferase-like isoleucine patch superfamily enzyme